MVTFTVFKGDKQGRIFEDTTTRTIGEHEVLVRITHSGLCGTDIHFKTSNIGLGHEGVGVVEEIGERVTLFKKGERAGWGYEHNSCGHCKQCLTGWETLCAERRMFGEVSLDQGSLGSHFVMDENFLFKIPESMSSAEAAPLMCGGATVFNPFKVYNIKSTDRVGVLGIGGLGHLAIQFAARWGCEVVVFSGTDSKKEEAMRLGATEFYAVKGLKELKIKAPLDHLLVTTASQPDWQMYLPLMAPSGTIFPLTVSGGDLKIPYMPFLQKALTVQGSLVAARQVHREMLDFAAHHNIRPIIQTFPMSLEGVNKAFDTLAAGDMRYRGVLVVE
ncbi:hypothetical protein PV08_07576 [Exophiala spinifera]|uniref:Enoyl reductase (ER) domain-containing protein n=1 Tax=Exophiala spinifera TaxID=91928 RepID=A0A0D1YIM7_9EURO|nr:uncharacterized protein PV08_07576 [Exophiala spinifera]KIW14791.1 hypothetical protein PV08_07576 [Exophiala spinifera]